MNGVALDELKIVVDQAVRPIRATIARKRKMREELLAHLVSIFKEEMQQGGDEQVALRQARVRFGDPRELTGQLQQAVPRWDRGRSMLENIGYQPGESVWHLAARHVMVMLMIYAFPLLVALPIVLVMGHHWDITTWGNRGWFVLGHMLVAGAALALFNAALSLVLAPLLNKLGPVMAGKRWGRISLAALCVLVLPLAFSGAFAGVAVVFILMARQVAQQWRYQKGWTNLQLAE